MHAAVFLDSCARLHIFGMLLSAFFFFAAKLADALSWESQGQSWSVMRNSLLKMAGEIRDGDWKALEYVQFEQLKSESFRLVRVKRCGRLVTVPDILIVKGDLLFIDANDDTGLLHDLFFDLPVLSMNGGRYLRADKTLLLHRLETHAKDRAARVNWMDQQSLLFSRLFAVGLAPFVALKLAKEPSSPLFCTFIYALICHPNLWKFLLRCYGSARILSLWQLLKDSKKPYDDIDEFDESEPPPTIDVDVPLRRIGECMLCLVRNNLQKLFLFEHIALTSFVVYTDRVGTLCRPFPLLTKVLIFSLNAFKGKAVVLDLVPFERSAAGVQFEDRGWMQFVSSLKPLGIAATLMKDCFPSNHLSCHRRDSPGSSESGWFRSRCIEQVCNCVLGKVLGVAQADVAEILPASTHSIIVKSSEGKASVLSIGIFSSPDGWIAFAEGPTQILRSISAGFWDGNEVCSFSKGTEEALSSFSKVSSNSDTFSTTFACRVISAAEAALISKLGPVAAATVADGRLEFNRAQTLGDLCMLGVAGFTFEPKEAVSAFIDDLEQAGIRFVFCSASDLRSTKAFGERLGLETDWNGCIILAEPDADNSLEQQYCDPSDINTRLPYGPTEIQKHLECVDDIPLHVSLFAHSYRHSGSEISSLLRIFVGQGETITVVGNCLNSVNSGIFFNADVGIGMSPAEMLGNQRISTAVAACKINAIFAQLHNLSFESCPYVLTETIREGRTLFRSSNQVLKYFYTVSVALTLHFCLCDHTRSSPLQILGFVLTVGLSGCSILLGNRHDPNVMKEIAPKRDEASTCSPKYLQQQKVYLLLRVLVIGICCRLLQASDATLFSYLSLLGSCYQHDSLSVALLFSPHRNRLWNLFAFSHTIFLFPFLQVVRLVLALIATIAVHEVCRQHYRVHWERLQKRLKLEFNTRLGMHSPV